MRVVSLLASATEIVCALDAGEWLVGRSHECDNPEWVKTLPRCSEPAFDISVTSREIDTEVRRRVRSGEPLYRIHTELIEELAPDLILTQSHCEVCAVTPGDVERSGSNLASWRTMAVSAGSVEGVFGSVMEIGHALGLEERARSIVEWERAGLAKLRARTAPLRRPSVVALEWTDPIFPMGNWGPELVEIANGDLALGNPEQHSCAITSEQVKAADPEYLIVAPCGFDLKRTCRELTVLQQNGWWNQLRAVREGKVAFADGNLFFNRAGMTIARTAEIIAEILHGVVSDIPTQGPHWRWMRDVAVAADLVA